VDRLGLGDYVRAAFKVPYNVILFTGGILAGIVSLQPLVVWPLVAAAELLYLATLASNRRFQAVVRARSAGARGAAAEDIADRVLDGLSPERHARFERVRERCRTLQGALPAEGPVAAAGILAREQQQAVNQLLWVLLRTLAHEQTLAEFCSTMPVEEIEQARLRTERELQAPGLSPEMKAAHEENREVLSQRLDNLQRAEENLRAIQARLVRVENSILLVQEQALTRRDPGFVEAEVRSVTAGLSSVEEMMRSMNLPQVDPLTADAVPEFLGRGATPQREAR
jgi:hypothetical protein